MKPKRAAKSKFSASTARRRHTIKLPDFSLPLIVIIVIAIIAAGIFAVTTAVQSSPTGQFLAPVLSCSENDYGLDASMQGTTLGSTAKSTISATDYCRSGKVLVEYWCDESAMKSSAIECAGSCVNGACIKLSE